MAASHARPHGARRLPQAAFVCETATTMAITAIEYSLIRSLRRDARLPLGGEVLELGQANWYGDVGVSDLRQDIETYAPPAARGDLGRRLDAVLAADEPSLFDLARIFWDVFLQPASMTAIDFHGTAEALKLDLNGPVDLGRRFDLVMNLGTIEHVFNVAEAVRTVHEHCRPGGLMLHGMPLSGWLEHGFYSFNSTFYFDLAQANDYAVEVALYTEWEPLRIVPLADRESIRRLADRDGIGPNSLLYVLLRRPSNEAPFRIPMQGYYAGQLSPQAAAAWREDR